MLKKKQSGRRKDRIFLSEVQFGKPEKQTKKKKIPQIDLTAKKEPAKFTISPQFPSFICPRGSSLETGKSIPKIEQ